MYIAPSGQIKILHDIPLDNTYQHTLYFASESAQSTWFSSRAKYTFNNQTYTRLQKGVIRVGQLADSIYDCNYIMYQNTNFGNKWFYGFIESIEYINNEVSEIRFEIDVIQTWYFEYNLLPCFVERMHSETDDIGDNIMPEPVETGEYIFSNGVTQEEYTSDFYTIVAVTDTQAPAGGATFYETIFSGSTLWVFDTQDEVGINAFLSTYNTRPDAVTSMYIIPAIFIIGTVPPGGKKLSEDFDVISWFPKLYEEEAITPEKTIDGYTPHNNKLYTYPYNFFRVLTLSGSKMSLRYEFFDNLTPCLSFNGCILLPVQVMAKPMFYKNADHEPQGESITLDGYPMCSWNVDAYNAWAAQNSIPILLDTVGSGVSMTVGTMLSPLAAGQAISWGINEMKDTLKETYKASIAPDMLKGSQANGSLAIAAREQSFYYGQMCVTNQYAKMIDSFFDMYGYAMKRIRLPLRKARTYWTYIKTANCVIEGSVPSDDANKICKIHDIGTCYWDAVNCDNHNLKIGNYVAGGMNKPLVT